MIDDDDDDDDDVMMMMMMMMTMTMVMMRTMMTTTLNPLLFQVAQLLRQAIEANTGIIDAATARVCPCTAAAAATTIARFVATEQRRCVQLDEMAKEDELKAELGKEDEMIAR